MINNLVEAYVKILIFGFKLIKFLYLYLKPQVLTLGSKYPYNTSLDYYCVVLNLKWTFGSNFLFYFYFIELSMWFWKWFLIYTKPLILKSSHEFGARFELIISLISFTLHQIIFNNLHKCVPTLMKSWV